MPATTPTALIDALDRLGAAPDGDAAWRASVRIAQDLGFSAINVADVDRRTGQPMWFRTAMPSDWLQSYYDEAFYTVDPLIAAGVAGKLSSRHTTGLLRRDAASRTAFAYDHEARLRGFCTLDLSVTRGPLESLMRGVVLVRDEDGPAPTPVERLISTAIAAASTPPEGVRSEGAVGAFLGPLSPREIDVLSHLAAGRRNHDIADRLGIAEVTVRTHIAAARRKLGAATREQAIVEAIRGGQLRL